MNKKELKSLIRPIVYECINEILAEKHVQNIVKEALNESLTIARDMKKQMQPQPLKETREVVQKNNVSKQGNEDVRQAIYKSMGISSNKDLFAEMMEDTAKSKNPILTSNHANGAKDDDLELVPENTMEKLGIFNKDWSKLI